MNLHDELEAAVRDLSDRELVILRRVWRQERDDHVGQDEPKPAHVLACLVVILRAEICRRRAEVKQLERDLHAGPDRVLGGWGSDDLR